LRGNGVYGVDPFVDIAGEGVGLLVEGLVFWGVIGAAEVVGFRFFGGGGFVD